MFVFMLQHQFAILALWFVLSIFIVHISMKSHYCRILVQERNHCYNQYELSFAVKTFTPSHGLEVQISIHTFVVLKNKKSPLLFFFFFNFLDKKHTRTHSKTLNKRYQPNGQRDGVSPFQEEEGYINASQSKLIMKGEHLQKCLCWLL